jgi:hypothetical protein
MLVPVAKRSKARVYGRSLAGIVVSNPARGMDFVCCECSSGRGLCDGLITRPEESYRLWCVLVCDLGTSRMRRLKLIKDCKCRIEEVSVNILISYWYGNKGKPIDTPSCLPPLTSSDFRYDKFSVCNDFPLAVNRSRKVQLYGQHSWFLFRRSCLRNQLSWLRCFMLFHSTFSQISEDYSGQAMNVSFHILSNSFFSNRRTNKSPRRIVWANDGAVKINRKYIYIYTYKVNNNVNIQIKK